MNIENFRKVIDVMEKHEEQIEMAYIAAIKHEPDKCVDKAGDLLTHRCNTAGCICGWTLAVFHPEALINTLTMEQCFKVAAEDLGMSHSDARMLFMGAWSHKYVDQISGAQVLEYMRKMLA